MKVIDERSKVREVAERWKNQYLARDGWTTTRTGDSGVIYEKLAALDPETATAADVAAIIGNNSWAGPDNCHECGADVPHTVELGQQPDYESHTAQICLSCLHKAVALLRDHRSERT